MEADAADSMLDEEEGAGVVVAARVKASEEPPVVEAVEREEDL